MSLKSGSYLYIGCFIACNRHRRLVGSQRCIISSGRSCSTSYEGHPTGRLVPCIRYRASTDGERRSPAAKDVLRTSGVRPTPTAIAPWLTSLKSRHRWGAHGRDVPTSLTGRSDGNDGEYGSGRREWVQDRASLPPSRTMSVGVGPRDSAPAPTVRMAIRVLKNERPHAARRGRSPPFADGILWSGVTHVGYEPPGNVREHSRPTILIINNGVFEALILGIKLSLVPNSISRWSQNPSRNS